jgi:hypothetical protein
MICVSLAAIRAGRGSKIKKRNWKLEIRQVPGGVFRVSGFEFRISAFPQVVTSLLYTPALRSRMAALDSW